MEGSTHLLRLPFTPFPLISLAHPLPLGEQSTLAKASARLGTPINLPSAQGMTASDVGVTWVRTDAPDETSVAITLPKAGLILQFDRPVPYPEPPAQMYQTEASQDPDSESAIQLNGTPALATAQNSDQTGQNFGAIEFVANGTRIAVLGHYDLETLRTYASALLQAASG